MKKVLITGVHGFVGSNLVVALKSNYALYGLDIISTPKEGVLNIYKWDELERVPAVDIVIHLAGKAHDTKNQTNAKIYFDINTGLTQKIFDWFCISEAKKFIFFSSVKAVADTVEVDFLTEDVVPKPKGPYGKSKIAAERYILQHMTDKSVYILRPCMIHGPGNKGNLNLLYSMVQKGIPYPLGNFENKRSFTSVDNLSYVITQFIKKPIDSGIYNICDDETLSTNEIISIMAKNMSKPIRIWKWNKSLIRLCSKIGTVLHFPLNEERLQKLTENYVVSNAKVKQALGIEKMPISASDGLVKTMQSFENK